MPVKRGLASLPIPLTTAPMEARLIAALPEEDGWQFEPKWDGFRCLAFRAGDEVALQAKSGKPLTRYFPEIVAMLKTLEPKRFVIDGELAVPVGTSLSFDALQARIHPAESRIRKLSVETPAIFITFDCLMGRDGTSLIDAPLEARRQALEALFELPGWREHLRLSPRSVKPAEARRWLERSGDTLDGVIAKPLHGPYLSGERAMLKVKRQRSADCVVGGFRYGTGKRQVGSLLLGLYDDAGKLDHVGFTSGIAAAEKPALTRKLEALIAPPGFTGDAPGGPSRWSTERSSEWQPLRPRLVVEVRYDQITGDRFRHGTRLLRWRTDKAPEQCTFDQLKEEARPSRLLATLLRR